MEEIFRSCCARLDPHQKVIVAYVIRSMDGKNARKSFSLASIPLLVGCSNYLIGWCPMMLHISVWKVLEFIGNWRILQNHFELQLANPRQIKNISRKKTDMKDAEWPASLTRLGVVPTSFIPPKPIQELRDLLGKRVESIWSYRMPESN